MISRNIKRQIRHKRIRAKAFGTLEKPRLTVHVSLLHLYAQLIDDSTGNTIVSVNDKEIDRKGTPSESAFELGKLIAKKANTKKIKEIIFDRSGYKYHGNVKSLACIVS